jgi:hypothetical protein
MMEREDLDRWRAVLTGSYRTEEDVYAAWDAAWKIVDRLMGREWTDKNLNPEKFNRHFRLGFPSPDDVRSHLRTHRLVQMGKRLYDLQGVPGFEHMLERARKESLRGLLAELEAAEKLRRRGYEVRFRAASGVGRDYDIDSHINGSDVAVEVKAKEEEGVSDPYKEKSMLNTLKEGRGQLPSNGPGLLFLGVPSDWVTAPEPRSALRQAVGSWLRGTGRVNAVVIMYDMRAPGPAGQMAFLTGHDVVPNPRPRTVLRNIVGILA